MLARTLNLLLNNSTSLLQGERTAACLMNALTRWFGRKTVPLAEPKVPCFCRMLQRTFWEMGIRSFSFMRATAILTNSSFGTPSQMSRIQKRWCTSRLTWNLAPGLPLLCTVRSYIPATLSNLHTEPPAPCESKTSGSK